MNQEIDNELLELKKERDERITSLNNYKKAIPKILLILVPLVFIMPYFPHRKIISLLEERGYWGSVLFGAVIYFVAFPIILYCDTLNRKGRIDELDKKIRRKKSQI